MNKLTQDEGESFKQAILHLNCWPYDTLTINVFISSQKFIYMSLEYKYNEAAFFSFIWPTYVEPKHAHRKYMGSCVYLGKAFCIYWLEEVWCFFFLHKYKQMVEFS